MLAVGFSQVIAGSAGVTTDMSSALNRYAGILEACQGEVRLCRQRLENLVASTPVGMVPDPVAVNAIVGQANDAYARAGQAARELSAAALNLIGGPTSNAVLPAAGDASVSFVSHAHSGGLASTSPSAAAFDVQAANIQAQMSGVMNSLTGLATSTPTVNAALYPSSTIVGGSNFSVNIGDPGILSGTGVIGGSSFSVNIGDPGILSGAGIIGGINSNVGSGGTFGTISAPTYTNPQLALIQAGENISRNNAIKVWQSAMPGVPVPSGSSGDILSQLLRQAPSLTPNELAAVGIINDSNNYGIRTQLLPPGWELVRETSYF
jgi:hypothetical protein